MAVPAVVAVGAVSAALAPRPDLASRRAARSAAAATALAVAVAVVVASTGPVAAMAEVAGTPIGLAAGELGAVLVVFVTGMAAIVQTYVARNLRGDPGQRRTAALGTAIATGTVVVVAAGSLPTLAAGWIAVSACALALVRHPSHADSPRARPHLTARVVAPVVAGDLALVGAVAVATAAWGPELLRWDAATPSLPLPPESIDLAGAVRLDAGALVGVLLVVAALARSAAFPFHGWLAASLDAPSPVSALLHGGVVNAGGLLLVITWPLVGWSSPGLALAAAGGALAVVVAAVAMTVRPDVKGALVLSTVSQMGFVLVQVAVGLTGAAVLHCLTHGAYKASRFLDAGRLAGHDAHGPPAHHRSDRRPAAAAVLGTTAASALVLGTLGTSAAAALWPLVPFVVVTAAVLAATWSTEHRPPVVVAAGAGALAGALGGLYLTIAHTIDHALVAAAPDGAATLSGWVLVALAPAVGASIALLGWARRQPALAPLADRVWAGTLCLAQPGAVLPGPRRRADRARPATPTTTPPVPSLLDRSPA